MTRPLWVAVLLVLLSGCAHAPAPAGPSPGHAVPLSFQPAVTTLHGCRPYLGVACFEPTLAADPAGRLFSTAENAPEFWVSVDGGATWASRPAPPMPTLAPAPLHTGGDNTLQVDPQGRLWFTRLVYENEAGATEPIPVAPLGRDLAGVQAARSDDGGDHWAVDHFFALQDPSPAVVTSADRQWLGFGPGRVYLAYWDYEMSTRHLLVSADGGATFGAPREVPGGFGGLPAVGSDGTLYLASFQYSEDNKAHVAIAWSRDGSAWETDTVADTEPGTLGLQASIDGADVLHFAWRAKDGSLMAAAGRPHAWSAPEALARNVLEPDPFVLAHDGVVDTMWFEGSGNGQDAVAVRDGPAPGARQRLVLAHWDGADPTSDFAWLARLPDGRVAATWTEPAAGVRVAVESPAPPA
jgi:hypothetical protein